MDSPNTKVVKDAYASFQRQDIPALLASLDEDVQWQAVIGTEGVVPTSGLRRGRAAVGEFFQQLAGSTRFDAFEPREFISEGDQVAVIGRYNGTAIPTNKKFESEWVMVFTLRNGKVVRFREYADSRALARAFE